MSTEFYLRCVLYDCNECNPSQYDCRIVKSPVLFVMFLVSFIVRVNYHEASIREQQAKKLGFPSIGGSQITFDPNVGFKFGNVRIVDQYIRYQGNSFSRI